ncbi:hypothetical protein ACFWBR_30070 [Streptomyces sp. NPDC060006]|uniref:hypothetical protein n=1 Tax=unclassified Streptomyces TaxID=2593676 RepID=UPI003681F8FE
MSDEIERGVGMVPVQYHQFDISDEDGPTGPGVDRRHNGLVRVADGVTIVMTGIHTGDVDVTVTLHEAEPVPDDGDWQEIVEVSAHSASGELMVRGMMDDLDEELPVLSANGPGEYRLRIAGTPPSTWPSTRSPSGTSSRPGQHLPTRWQRSARPMVMGRQSALTEHGCPLVRPLLAVGRTSLMFWSRTHG